MSHEHLSAERIQALLEGELPEREQARIEEHLAGCARCAAEHDAWRVLFEDLADLPTLGPEEGFTERVMAGVRARERRPLAARVRAHLAAMAPTTGHVDERTLLELLDGALAPGRAADLEEHLAACETCSAEAEAWLPLFASLRSLERFAPAPGFAERVMAEVAVPETVPLVARLRRRLAGLAGAGAERHPEPGLLQDFVEGLLPARRRVRLEAHVAACGSCAHEVDAWRLLKTRLDGLERFAPTETFQDRVMAAVRIPALVPAVAPAPVWTRALALARRFVPRTRRAWAAISGVAVTPAVSVGVFLYAVFSHPTLTPGALAAFAWWQVTDLAAFVWEALTGLLVQGAQLFDAYSLLGAAASAPMVLAGGVLAYVFASSLALRVLYKNLIARRPTEGRYAQVSVS